MKDEESSDPKVKPQEELAPSVDIMRLHPVARQRLSSAQAQHPRPGCCAIDGHSATRSLLRRFPRPRSVRLLACTVPSHLVATAATAGATAGQGASGRLLVAPTVELVGWYPPCASCAHPITLSHSPCSSPDRARALSPLSRTGQ